MRVAMKTTGKLLVKTLFTLLVLGIFSLPFITGQLKDSGNPLSRKKATELDTATVTILEDTQIIEPPQADILESIPQFVTTPEGGTSWNVFGETIEHEYTYKEDDEYDYVGVRPEFSEKLKKLDGQTVIVQGYMFPLGQGEEQPRFLLGPFPLSCPYHYHVPPKLLLEVHAETPVKFSYDAVNIQGILELVPNDDEYNVFYRLRNAGVLQ
ncbi:MAG: hypothetical protein COB36_02895 [Alphaproteobacteria bacterium]|nr:MAG: hypothetical protein COB36_02895 [Alphaproteobacteria bacterium]